MELNKNIKVIGFDPSMANWGWAKATVNIDTLDWHVTDLGLIETKNESKKNVIKESDDLRRARELFGQVNEVREGCSVIFSEIPLGNAAMYNNAILASGIVVGILASIPSIIQVFPKEVKMLAVGNRNADKSEMIEWATNKFPHAPWLTRLFKGKARLTAKNEHLADAVAIINAGLQTQQFRTILEMYKAMRNN